MVHRTPIVKPFDSSEEEEDLIGHSQEEEFPVLSLTHSEVDEDPRSSQLDNIVSQLDNFACLVVKGFSQSVAYYLARAFYDIFYPQVEYFDGDVEDKEFLENLSDIAADNLRLTEGFGYTAYKITLHLQCSNKPIEEHIKEKISEKIIEEFNHDEEFQDVFRRWANDLVRGKLLNGCLQTKLGRKSCSNLEWQQAKNTIQDYFKDKIMKDNFRDFYGFAIHNTLIEKQFDIKIAT